MSRITITLPKKLHNKLSVLSVQNEESISKIINYLIGLGMQQYEQPNTNDFNKNTRCVEEHTHQLIIQMNALVKNLSMEVLKYNSIDFDNLGRAALSKYNELLSCQ